jgi:hypothetical protein
VEAISALTDAAYFIPLIGRKPRPMTADYSIMVTEDTIWLLSVEDQLAGVLVLTYELETLLIWRSDRPGIRSRVSGAFSLG